MNAQITRALFGVLGISVVMGCSPLPSRYIQQAEPGVTLTSLTKSREGYQGKTVILGGVVVDQKQDGQRLWLHLKNRPLDKDYRPHRPTVNDGPEAGYYWVVVPNASTLPPKWKQWTRVTVVGRVTDSNEVGSSIEPTSEPVLSFLFMRGWTMGQSSQGRVWEESVDANYLLSVPEGLHGE
ncbi:MAG: Slp family lipoprotein [Nitrospira sp.]|nr:Slp family lipoprotein [Nitrospira sp.]